MQGESGIQGIEDDETTVALHEQALDVLAGLIADRLGGPQVDEQILDPRLEYAEAEKALEHGSRSHVVAVDPEDSVLSSEFIRGRREEKHRLPGLGFTADDVPASGVEEAADAGRLGLGLSEFEEIERPPGVIG